MAPTAEYMREYRKKHPEKNKEACRRWQQNHPDEYKVCYRKHNRNREKGYNAKHYLRIGGKLVRVDKRPQPNHCEICGRSITRLNYHHWDDKHPEWGVWLCFFPCHYFIEAIDSGYLEKGFHTRYLQLRESIERIME